MSHTRHPDTLEHGLCDDCPECVRKAKNPVGRLDDAHVADLWCRMVAVEHPSTPLDEPYGSVRMYRSAAEAEACGHLYNVALFLERHTPVDPWDWPVARTLSGAG